MTGKEFLKFLKALPKCQNAVSVSEQHAIASAFSRPFGDLARGVSFEKMCSLGKSCSKANVYLLVGHELAGGDKESQDFKRSSC